MKWGTKLFRERSERNNFVPHFKNYGASSACMLLCYEHFNGNLSDDRRYNLASAPDRYSNADAFCSVNIRMSFMTRKGARRREQTSSRFQSFAVPPSSRAWFGNFGSCQSLLQMPAVSHQPQPSTWYNRVAFSCEWGIYNVLCPVNLGLHLRQSDNQISV